jgi:hypothetical protein
MAAAACLMFGIIILIRNKDGSTTRIEVPANATVELQQDGKAVPIPGESDPAKPVDKAANVYWFSVNGSLVFAELTRQWLRARV